MVNMAIISNVVIAKETPQLNLNVKIVPVNQGLKRRKITSMKSVHLVKNQSYIS